MKDRIDQKYNHERSVPLKFRTLAETLNPQPDAHVVFQRLLDFIERCDIASQLGLPRPEFKTLDGEAIFPEDEEPWWLTEVSKRISAEDRRDDEDGPATDDEGEEEQKEVSDEDPLSEHECVVESSGQHHNPNVAWRCAEPDAKEKEVDKPPAE